MYLKICLCSDVTVTGDVVVGQIDRALNIVHCTLEASLLKVLS